MPLHTWFPWNDLCKMSKIDGQGTKWCRQNAENCNCLSKGHEHYRRQTDGRQQIANVNVSSRSLTDYRVR